MISFRLLDYRYNILKQFNRNLKFFKSKSEPTVKETDSVAAEAVTTDTSTLSKPLAQSIILPRIFKNVPSYLTPRKIWVENLDTLEPNHLGIMNVHPEVFGARPRLDLIHHNIDWQRKYKYVDYTCLPAKHEIKRSTRKPWPQKGTGRARHGTRRSPLFKGGVKIHGPRGPRTSFFMPTTILRVHGLCSTLSVKLIQDDLHVVNNLEIPVDDPQYLLDLAETRKWGPSVLFVDVSDIMPRNIAVACNSIKQMNLMPMYGLNVYSMLKYVTLVLTVDAAEKLEEKLVQQLHNPYVDQSNKLSSA